MNLHEWITKHYAILNNIANSYSDDGSDIVTYYYIYLEKGGWNKICNLPENEQMKFSRVWLKNTSGYTMNNPFAELKTNNLPEDYEVKDILDENYEDECEYNIRRLLIVNYHYTHSLDLTEQILFQLRFVEHMTTRAIAKKINIPHTSTYLHIKKLEDKLKSLCKIK